MAYCKTKRSRSLFFVSTFKKCCIVTFLLKFINVVTNYFGSFCREIMVILCSKWERKNYILLSLVKNYGPNGLRVNFQTISFFIQYSVFQCRTFHSGQPNYHLLIYISTSTILNFVLFFIVVRSNLTSIKTLLGGNLKKGRKIPDY